MKRTQLTTALALTFAYSFTGCGGDDGDKATGGFSASGETGDGDGDPAGDGDGDSSGDGDGDSSGDGDGDSSGDGDGDSSGDGDGDGDSSGDGDGDGDTSGDGDGDGDTAGDGDGDVIVPCEIPEIDLATVVPHVILVLDKSGSMVSNSWDHDANGGTPDITRWNSLHNVVTLVVNNFDSQFEFGAQLYPSTSASNGYNANACLVNNPLEVPIAPANAANVLLGIPAADSDDIHGGTPTSSGMSSAIDHLVDVDDGDAAAIILVTDGAANCWQDAGNVSQLFEIYDPDLLGIVGDAYSDLEIPTYVVGIDIQDELLPNQPDGQPDGINPLEQLNELAVAGGKPLGGQTDFYQTQNELDLQEAVQAIVDDAQSCTVLLDPAPPFPDFVEVIMNDMAVPQVVDCENEDGWVYTNPNGPYDSLELCGTWCEMVPMAQSFVAEYYCNAG